MKSFTKSFIVASVLFTVALSDEVAIEDKTFMKLESIDDVAKQFTYFDAYKITAFSGGMVASNYTGPEPAGVTVTSIGDLNTDWVIAQSDISNGFKIMNTKNFATAYGIGGPEGITEVLTSGVEDQRWAIAPNGNGQVRIMQLNSHNTWTVMGHSEPRFVALERMDPHRKDQLFYLNVKGDEDIAQEIENKRPEKEL